MKFLMLLAPLGAFGAYTLPRIPRPGPGIARTEHRRRL